MLFDTQEPPINDGTIIKKWSINKVLSDSNNEETVQYFIGYLCSEKVNKKSPFFNVYYKEKSVITTNQSPSFSLKKGNIK